MKRPPHLHVIVAAALLLLPTLVYWSTIFHRYGFRDDYSILRESLEEPGKVTRVCTMQARPLFGLVLEQSFARLRGIDDLQWLRLIAAVLLGAAGATTFLLLRRAKWDSAVAAMVAALMTVLPGAQMLVSWTVSWARGLALLLTLAAFACGERAFGDPRRPLRAGWWVAATLLVTASALIYQPDTLFYFVPVAAALWPRRRWVVRTSLEWFIRHAVTVVLGLAAAFTGMMVAFAAGKVPTSSRIGLEQDWLGKMVWFVADPLQNAFATIVLNDDDGSRTAHRAAILVAIVLLAGIGRVWQTRGRVHAAWWAAALGALLLGSFSVNLVVNDRWPVYRVMLPLTGVVIVFAATSLLILGGRHVARFGLALLLLAGAWLAHRQAFALVAWPQGLELALLERGAAAIPLERHPRVFVITPTPFDHATDRIYCDEFGSLSTDSDWLPKEMLKLVLHEQHPGVADIEKHYTYACGRLLPKNEHFDTVIDLRKIRDFRGVPTNRPIEEAMFAEASALH